MDHRELNLFQAVLDGGVARTKGMLGTGASVDVCCPCGCGAGVLIAAAISGKVEIVQALLRAGADVEATSVAGRTPLMEAASWDRPEILELLLEAGADPRVGDTEGETALDAAVRNGRAANVLLLLEAGAEPDRPGEARRETALAWAARNGELAVIDELLERGAVLEQPSLSGRRPLAAAVVGGQVEAARRLLEGGAELEATDDSGRTALLSWLGRDNETLEVLLAAGADANRQDEDGVTALHLAARSGNQSAVESLLEHGAQPTLRNRLGRTALEDAAAHGHLAVVGILLSGPAVGASPASRAHSVPSDADRALGLAAAAGHRGVAELLLERGAEIDALDAHGYTPLLQAVRGGHLELAEILLERDANLQHRTNGGLDLLGAACSSPRAPEMVSWLLATDRVFDLDAALLVAAPRGDTGAVRLLLSAGADPNAAKTTSTALLAAVGHGAYDDRYRRPKSRARDPMAEVVLALLEAGADPATGPGAQSLLSEAIALRCPEVARALLKAGAIFEPEEPWITPLAQAVNDGQVVLVKMLLSRGADPDRPGRGATSARELARRTDKASIRRALGVATGDD